MKRPGTLTRTAELEREARLTRDPRKVLAWKRRRRSDSPQLRAFKRAHRGHLCDGQVAAAGCERLGAHAHHLRIRAQGGTDAHTNLAWLCAACHRWVHSHPLEAARLGLLVLRPPRRAELLP